MTHTEYEWMLDGKTVFAQSWLPENEPGAVIVMIHGLGEHSGRYEFWAKLFTEAGYGFLTTDLIGHGRTEGKTGHTKSYQLLLDQVDLLISKSGELFPGIPRVLYGHSMGGNIVINYAIAKDPPINALIASSPWLRLVNPVGGIEKIFTQVFNAIAPALTVKAGRVGAEKLSRNPEHWEDVRSDPVVHRKVSVRYGHEIIKYGEHALRNASRINKPFLLMHGDADEITSHKASEELASRSPEKTRLKIWEGLRHELHNELENREVFKYILSWLKEQGL
jgi:alpha-beta hydrolase superfamily lysophospholipase